MLKHLKYKTFWLVGLLCVLSAVMLVKGCEQDSKTSAPAAPAGTVAQTITLKFAQAANPNAKTMGLTINAVGLDDQGNPQGPQIDPVVVKEPVFPLAVQITLFKPPCKYRITVTADLARDTARTKSTVVDICAGTSGELALDTFEPFTASALAIDAPESANAGDSITVSCAAPQVSAPDNDRYPLTMTLRERGGKAVSPQQNTASVSGSFPDPFPATSAETQRVFTCLLTDGRSTPQTVEKTIARILPTPTPTPTPMPTATPIPLCVVQNANDSGTGSLRQVLADALTNGCSTITFAPGVSTITLTSGQLTVPAMAVTINGGAGVTISGNNSSRVFYVNSANVTFENLVITGGRVLTSGGGIYNDGGFITVNSTVSGNHAEGNGGGIYVSGGSGTINGTVTGNSATGSGGGIYNTDSSPTIVNTVTVNGAVIGNSANFGGGIYTGGLSTVVNGSVTDNSATESGGGIYAVTGVIGVNSTVSGNSAKWGGGIFIDGGQVGISFGFGTVSGNSATVSGGGIYNNGLLDGDPATMYGSGNYTPSAPTINNCAGTAVAGGVCPNP